MASIAYITDQKMLEFHRLNANRTMNFWRLNPKTSFSDFGEGDLVFFLSKDRKDMNGKEKGITGFGIVSSIHQSSVDYMWRRYRKENGYNSIEEFREAITKVSRNDTLPEKISSLYLEEVTFFQAPIYLSECGMNISPKVESYIYIRDEEVVLKLLNYAIGAIDIWSSRDGAREMVERQRILRGMSFVQRQISDPQYDDRRSRRAFRKMRRFIESHPEYSFVGASKTDVYTFKDDELYVVLYYEKGMDVRAVLGQAQLYHHYFQKYDLGNIHFRLSETVGSLNDLLK